MKKIGQETIARIRTWYRLLIFSKPSSLCWKSSSSRHSNSRPLPRLVQ